MENANLVSKEVNVHYFRLNSRLWLALGALSVICLVAGTSVGQVAAPPPAGPPAVLPSDAPSPAPVENDPEHLAKGEIRCGDAWVPIDKVFQDYRAVRAEVTGQQDTANAARTKIAELQYQLTAMKNDAAIADRPARAEMAKAKGQQRDFNHVMDVPSPQKPVLRPIPPAPRRTSYSTGGGGGSSYGAWGSGSGGYNSGNNNNSAYDNAMQDWQRTSQILTQQNNQLNQKYNQDYGEWKKKQDDAKKEMPKLNATIKDCGAKLDRSQADLAVKQAPTLEKVKAANDEALAIGRQVAAVEYRLKVLFDALRAAPELMRFQHNIVEWETVFHPLSDLEKMLAETQAEVNRVRDQMKSEATAAGRTFDPKWRHPQQDRLDALKTLIDRAKAAQTKA